MNAAPRPAEVVKRARRGVLLSEALASSGSSRPGDLDGGQRLHVVDTLIATLGGAYAHLPAKRAAYASDPVQALILLRRRAADLSDTEFNRAVTAIVTGLRDAHTRYVGPSTLRDQVAVLPFLAEQYGPESNPRYLVSKINTEAIDDPEFQPGVELEAWNGAPFARAVESHADSETGAKKLVFAPNLWASDHQRRPSPAATGKVKIGEWLDTPMQDVVAARALSRRVGYLRIWSFDIDDDDAFVDELIRLLGVLPQTALIVDLGTNPGGLIYGATNWIGALFGGMPVVRFVHHVGTWGFLIFIPIHVYLAIRADLLERTGVMSSIVSGGRFVPADRKFVDE